MHLNYHLYIDRMLIEAICKARKLSPVGQALFLWHLMLRETTAVPEDAVWASVKTAVYPISFNKFPMVLNAAMYI